jgi:hypothetical protein
LFYLTFTKKQIMKKLLLTSLLMLCASLAYANSGCGGCGDSDKKDGKADYSQNKIVLAGGCGDKSDDKKDGKADSIQSNAVLAGGCGDKSDDKKDGKSDFTVRQAAIV